MGFFRLPDVFYTKPTPPTHHKLRYGKKPMQFVNIRIPQGKGPFPLVFTIHGGQWKKAYTHKQMEFLCEQLKQQQIATCNIEFRRLGHQNGTYPNTIHDIYNAIQYTLQPLTHVPNHANVFGCLGQPTQPDGPCPTLPIDTNNITILGHSSGAHLAFCIANTFKPHRLIGMSGVYDLQTCSPNLQQVAQQYFQDHPLVSPTEQMVETHLIVGDQDKLLDQAQQYKQTNPQASLNIIPNCSHFNIIDPTYENWPIILQTITSPIYFYDKGF